MRKLALLLLLGVAATISVSGLTMQGAYAKPCGDSTSAASEGDSFHIGSQKGCDKTTGENGSNTETWPRTTTIDCGPPAVFGHNLGDRHADANCALVQNVCAAGSVASLPKDPRITTTATIQQAAPNASWQLIGFNCNVLSGQPRVTPLLVRQEVVRLVPRVGIGVAPPGGKTLVNVQTVLWADTPVDRSLGTVTLLGVFRVGLRIHVQGVVWGFGDGSSDTTTSPGEPYHLGEHCQTVTCPGHYGHVYTQTGAMTITSEVRWSGQYSVNGGAWQDIPGTVDGPPATTQVVVYQARGVLVPDPTPS